MTLNVGTGAPPSLHQQQTLSPQILEPNSRYTVDTPKSSTIKPATSSTPTFAPQQFLPLLSPHQELIIQPRSFSTEQSQQNRVNSQSRKVYPPARRRHNSKSPERNRGTGGTGQGNGRRSYPNQTAGSKHSTPAMQGRRNEGGQSIAIQRPSLKYNRSNSSVQSSSLPSTPNHNPRQSNGLSRSPSPSCALDSPRSALSEPVIVSPYKPPVGGCIYETALVNARRRMPYSLGNDRIAPEKPKLEKLTSEQEAKLTKDMIDLFEKLKPSSESNEKRRRFLVKLENLLNDEWPGHDIKVHAFGSTENHLCMSDSDVDVCITTKWKEFNHVCRLARTLAKHGMERVVCVPGAKVPIVKVWDPEYQVACDMNINNTLALDNTKMIKTYVEIDDRVRPLAMIIKYWTKQNSLNDAAGGGTLSSYTWICMILNFLQTRNPPILPSLHQRPHKKRPPISGVDISFDDDIEALRGFGMNNKETLGELLFAFFKKYGYDLDYDTSVISVRHGKLLTKEEKEWQFKQNNRLCVEEPFNTSRNLGNTADDYSWKGLHKEFRKVYEILADKADLDACLELYVPPEEPQTSAPPLQAQHRPVSIARSNSSHTKRRDFNGNGRGRGPQWHNSNGHNLNNHSNHNHNNHNHNSHGNHNNRPNQNKRASNGAYGAQLSQQYLQQETFGYIPSPQDQILALQAQFHQAHIRAQALAQAQAVQQAQVHAQTYGQQSQSSATSINSLGPAQNHQDVLALHPTLATYAYFAQLYGMNLYYPNPLHSEGSSTPASPHIANDTRSGYGTGRRQNGYNMGPRSQSQPPPEVYPTPGYGNGTSTAGAPGSEDEDFADHSSNGNPVTPPAEEQDEYVGYYAIGGSLQHVPAVIDSVEEEEEPFLEQKSLVDRQKRLSQEKLPTPLLGASRDASGALGLENTSASRDHFNEHRSPVIVNGSIPVQSSTFTDTPFSSLSSPSEVLYSYNEASPRIDYHGSDGTLDPAAMGPKEISGHTQLYAQKLLEVHTQAAGNRPEHDLTDSNMVQQHIDTPISDSSILLSPKAESQPLLLTSDDEATESISSTRLSPNLRQRAATQQLLWSNTRAPAIDSLKPKGSGLSKEGFDAPPKHVPDTLVPSSVPKKDDKNDIPTKQQNKSRNRKPVRSNGGSEKPPPTPAEKSAPKNGTGSKQRSGTASNGSKANAGPKAGAKNGWERIGNAGKGRKQVVQKTVDPVPLNEVERKGG